MKPSQDFRLVKLVSGYTIATFQLWYKDHMVMLFNYHPDDEVMPVLIRELNLKAGVPVLNTLHALQIATSILTSYFTRRDVEPDDIPEVIKMPVFKKVDLSQEQIKSLA